jgi:bacterioferritin (cytochrome b1)
MNRIERAIEMLNEVLRRKINSPAAYVLEASPYATENDRPVVEAIEALNAAARRHAEEAARQILVLEGVPYSGSFDPAVAESNYLSVRYLLGRLLTRLAEDIALFEQYCDRCEVPEAKEFLARVVEEDKGHCDRLHALREQIESQRPDVTTHAH